MKPHSKKMKIRLALTPGLTLLGEGADRSALLFEPMNDDDMDIPGKLGIPDYEFRVVIGGTTVDYDLEKEDVNRKKHGYSLQSAIHLLERYIFPIGGVPPHAVSDAFVENGEVRHMHMSVDDNGKVVHMVTTMRPNETVRVISFRRASRAEREKFRELTGYAEQ